MLPELLIPDRELVASAAFLLVSLGASFFLAYLLKPQASAALRRQGLRRLTKTSISRLRIAAILVGLAYVSYFSLFYLDHPLQAIKLPGVHTWLAKVLIVFLAFSLSGFFFKLINLLREETCRWTERKDRKITRALLLPVSSSLKVVALLMTISFFSPYGRLCPAPQQLVDRVETILPIILLAWVLCQWVNSAEVIILAHYELKFGDSVQSKRLNTHIAVLKKILLALVFLVSIAAIGMTFEKAREVGTTLLTSAAVMTAILGFAAQRPVAALLTGLQLAVAQPVRIYDVVSVEGEHGYVEEIHLSYVVIKTWEQKRLLVPSRYFLENPFQYLTRNPKDLSSDLLGAVLFYLDYLLPLEEIREKFHALVRESAFWNQKVAKLQIA